MGQGAPTPSISEEFLQAYQRGQFFTQVATPPLTEVTAYGPGGYRQEFQDISRSGLRFALIRPANPNYSLGINNVVRQVRPPITAVLNRSSIGVATAGFPLTDTSDFFFIPTSAANTQIGGSYQTFDKNFAIFVWSSPPLGAEGSDVFEITVADPIYTKWNNVGIESLGAPTTNVANVTSRFNTAATRQRFVNGAIYVIGSGSLAGRAIFVRRNVLDLYLANQAEAGFLGLPLSDEALLADGRRRQSFEGGTVEFTLNGVPVIKNAVQTVAIAGDNPIRLVAGQAYPLVAQLQTSASESVNDREVFWTTSNGLVASVSGAGPRVTLQALRGGTAVIRATSEGKTSQSLTVYVSGVCCALGEGAPSQSIAQAFADAVQRNRLSLRLPLSSPVRRLGAGYVQEGILSATGGRILIAKPDSAPLAFVVSGSLLAAYDGLRGVNGILGFPMADVSAGGTQQFELGALAGVPVRVVSGPILARWRALGWENGVLGAPLSDGAKVLTFTGSDVLVQRFANGVCVQYLAGPLAGRAFVVGGVIAAKFMELGGAGALAGAPLTDEFQSGGLLRQEFEGATLEFSPGQSVRIIEKARRPALSITPTSLLPGARYRVSVGGFSAGARLRITQGGSAPDSFEVNSASGAYTYESIVPAGARPGPVILRATNVANAQSFVEASYTVRTLVELRPQVVKLSGDQQSGAPSTLLPELLRVRLTDSAGNPLANIPLRFEASPGGQAVNADAVTNAEGIAQTSWRLPPQAGIALLSVQSAGSTVSFTARAAAYELASFPKLSQDQDGFLGNSSATLRRKGSLVAAMASVVRFYQLRGIVPRDAGLADVNLLNSFLRDFCDPSGPTPVCDGFLSSGNSSDPLPNPLRILEFTSGVLDWEALPPSMDELRQSLFSDTPVILALAMNLPGQAPGVHFVAATGIQSVGDIQVVDSHPDFSRSTISQYLNGLQTPSGLWQVQWVAAFRFVPRGARSSAFFLYGNSPIRLTSASPSCQPAVSWPASYAEAGGSSSGASFHLQACDSNGGAYRLDVPGPFLVTLTAASSPASQSVVSGVADAIYTVLPRNNTWTLGEVTLRASAVLQAASFEPLLSPGSLISVFGSGLPRGADGIDAVEWNGQPLPIFFSNGFQLNTVLLEGGGRSGSLKLVSRFGTQSLPLDLVEHAPAVFMLSSGFPAIVNQDSSLNSPASPAIRGQVISLYGTGFGQTEAGPSGLRNLSTAPVVLLQETELRPLYAGLAPGFLGLYQMNLQIPASLSPGLNQELRIRQGEAFSPLVRISLR